MWNGIYSCSSYHGYGIVAARYLGFDSMLAVLDSSLPSLVAILTSLIVKRGHLFHELLSCYFYVSG